MIKFLLGNYQQKTKSQSHRVIFTAVIECIHSLV